MIAKQTEKTVYKTADKNTEDKNTQKHTRYTPDTKICDVQSHCRYSHTSLKMWKM